MQCFRCLNGFNAGSRASTIARAVSRTAMNASTKRTFTSFLGPSRPVLFPSAFQAAPRTSPMTAPSISAETIDLHSKISAHPALGATQVRGAKRDTFSPSHFVRKRRHGFLSRIRTRKGRATLQRRRTKGRSTLSH